MGKGGEKGGEGRGCTSKVRGEGGRKGEGRVSTPISKRQTSLIIT